MLGQWKFTDAIMAGQLFRVISNARGLIKEDKDKNLLRSMGVSTDAIMAGQLFRVISKAHGPVKENKDKNLFRSMEVFTDAISAGQRFGGLVINKKYKPKPNSQ